MAPAIENLIRVTGMGSLAAEAFLKGCSPAEEAMIAAGDVQAALDAKANRKEPPRKLAANFVPLSERKSSPAGKPAASPSEPASEAGTVENDPDLP